MHMLSGYSGSPALPSVCVVIPVGGGSGLRGRILKNWVISVGAEATELTQLKFSGLPRTLQCGIVVLNEGLQGVSRRALRATKGLRGRHTRVVAVVRSFAFAKSDWRSVYNAIDVVVCVSDSLQGLFLDLFPQYREKCRVIREYPSGFVVEHGTAPRGRGHRDTPRSVIIPRVYKWQHRALIDVGWHLANMGLDVSILIDAQSDLRSALHARHCSRLTLSEPVPELSQLLPEFDAVLMGGAYPEGWGLLYEESILAGCTPLVLANSGGLVEQWVRRRVGRIANPTCALSAALSFTRIAPSAVPPTAENLCDSASPGIVPTEQLWLDAILGETTILARS